MEHLVEMQIGFKSLQDRVAEICDNEREEVLEESEIEVEEVEEEVSILWLKHRRVELSLTQELKTLLPSTTVIKPYI